MLMEERRRKFSQIVDLYSAPFNCSIEMHYVSCYASQKVHFLILWNICQYKIYVYSLFHIAFKLNFTSYNHRKSIRKKSEVIVTSLIVNNSSEHRFYLAFIQIYDNISFHYSLSPQFSGMSHVRSI